MIRRALVPLALALLGCAHSTPAPTPASSAAPPPPRLAETPRFKNVPPWQLDQARLNGAMPHLPDDVKWSVLESGKQEVIGMYKVCVDTSGQVAFVAPVGNNGIAGADGAITAQLRTWEYKPQAVGICSMIRFHFNVSSEPPPRLVIPAPAPPAAPLPPSAM
jgi:hypothetical protein